MRILLLSCFLSSAAVAGAQMKEGKVIYERTVQMQFRRLNISPEMEQNLPKERKETFELSFTSKHSLWESAVEIEDETETTEPGPNRNFVRFGGNNDVAYHNFETGRRVDLRELNSKNFIVEDSIRKLNWKLTGETKTILGHTVQKATTERYGTRTITAMENGEMKRQPMADTTVIVAWFAPDIPVPAGPEFGGQLPGLILELDMNNGRIVYKALELLPKVNTAAIKEPKSGKRVTSAEFDKEREKMFEEMRRNMPPGMQVRIAD